jgi:hypothetical protein
MNWYQRATARQVTAKKSDFAKGFLAVTAPLAGALPFIGRDQPSAPVQQPPAMVAPPTTAPATMPTTAPATQSAKFDVATEVTQRIMQHEGSVDHVYADPLHDKGKPFEQWTHPTIGVGHLTAGPNSVRKDDPELRSVVGGQYPAVIGGQAKISKEQMKQLLMIDVRKAVVGARQVAQKNGITFDQLNPELQATMVEMTFQMGPGGLAKFPKMLAAIRDGRYGEVPQHMLNSTWAKNQTANRAREMANRLTTRMKLPTSQPAATQKAP